MLRQHDSQQDSQKTQHEPILSFALPLARPAAFFVTATQKKIMCLLSEMTHDDIFKRGWASCSTNQFAGAPSSKISDMLAHGARK